MSCIRDDELVLFADEQTGAARARELDAHFAACASCRGKRDALLALTAKLAPPRRADGGVFVARTLARIDAEERASQRGRTPWWRRAGVLASFGAAAAAAVVVLLVVRPDEGGDAARGRIFPRAGGAFTARGAASDALWRIARADVQRVRGGNREPLSSGMKLAAGEGLGVSCTNLGAEPLHLLVFGVDDAGEVHWFFPAYRSATEDPHAIVVRAGSREEALPEVVRPSLERAMKVRVVTVISRRARTVKAVEALLAGRRAGDTVADRFGDDRVAEWLVHIDAEPR